MATIYHITSFLPYISFPFLGYFRARSNSSVLDIFLIYKYIYLGPVICSIKQLFQGLFNLIVKLYDGYLNPITKRW